MILDANGRRLVRKIGFWPELHVSEQLQKPSADAVSEIVSTGDNESPQSEVTEPQ